MTSEERGQQNTNHRRVIRGVVAFTSDVLFYVLLAIAAGLAHMHEGSIG